MLKSKFFSATILAIVIFYVAPNIRINNISTEKNNVIINEKKASIKINNFEYSVDLIGGLETPDENSEWKQINTESKDKITFFWKNKEGAEFFQVWNFENKEQPTLELFTKNTDKYIKKEIIIKSDQECESFAYQDNKWIKSTSNKVEVFEGMLNISAMSSKSHVTAVKSSDRLESHPKYIKIHKKNNTENNYEKIYIHNSKKDFLTLNNQKAFENLSEVIDFGYFHKTSKSFYLILKKLDESLNNIYLAFLILLIIISMLSLPWTLKTIKMQKILKRMEPELKVVKNYNPNSQAQEVNRIHQRYGYSIFPMLYTQLILLVSLSIFNGIFNNIELQNLIAIPHEIIMGFLALTLLMYNKVMMESNGPQAYFSVFIAFFYISYNCETLIAFILSHWAIILMSFLI